MECVIFLSVVGYFANIAINWVVELYKQESRLARLLTLISLFIPFGVLAYLLLTYIFVELRYIFTGKKWN